jgi:AraC-like DNA-binding protein
MQPDLELVQVSRNQSFKAWSHGYPFRTVRWHFHPEYELHLVTHTTGTFMVGDHVGSFEPGHLVLIGPNLPHNWISNLEPGQTISERGLVLQFTHESMAAAAAAFPELAVLDPLLAEAQRGIEFGPGLYADAHDLMASLIEATGIRRLVLFLELVDRLAHHGARRILLGPGYRPDPDCYMAGTLNHVLAHIGSHLGHDLSEAEMAHLCGRSPSAFSRLFRKHTGMSFVQYVNRLRIDYACHLLMSGAKSITDICFEVGFNNLSNFNRQFLAHKGMPPSRFRASHLTVATPAVAGAPPLSVAPRPSRRGAGRGSHDALSA